MSGIQTPTAAVVIGGVACEAVTELELILQASQRASTFRLAIPFDAVESPGPLSAVIALATGSPPGTVSAQIGIGLSGFSPGSRTMLVGIVDRATVDITHGLLELEGRDLVARLLGTAVTRNFVNQTASDIVATVANDAGLAASIVPTTSIIGQYYQVEHARSALALHSRYSNAWELVSHLASLEQFDCWMDATTLHFEPPAGVGTNVWNVDVRAVRQGGASAFPAERLRFDCNLDIGVRPVLVRSWNNREAVAIERTFPDAGVGSDEPSVFVIPNLTSETALARAVSLYREISRHRYVISGDMPGDLVLAPRDRLLVSASGVGLDGAYTVDTVIRHIDRRGYRQSFVARAA